VRVVFGNSSFRLFIGNTMLKHFSIAMTTVVFSLAHAQTPPSASAEQAPVTNSRPQARADAKVASRPAGQVKAGAGGDINNTSEGGAIGVDKAALAGERRSETRDARRRAKDGTVKRKSGQGGTPE
jgi:hypothetical protein